MERTKKKLYKMFADMGLKITLETNLPKVDFLDITMNLHEENFQPYRKPNDTPLYVHTKSNHPPHVIKNLPTAINKRLSEISSEEDLFNKHKTDYEQALKKSGHESKLEFDPTIEPNQTKKRNRGRNVTWYNPPYNMTLKTNIGKDFLKLIDKHFPRNHVLNPIINRKTVKISYSCSPNIDSIISSHNKKVLSGNGKATNTENCNCRDKVNCPTPGKCSTECVIYSATVEKTGINYIGMTQNKFKTRYTQHVHSFKTASKMNATTLSQYIWDKKMSPNPKIKWNILKKCTTYQPGNRSCDLCISEKLAIIKNSNNPNNINKRNDIGTRCIHRKNFKLDRI